MKFINYLSSIAGIGIYPLISLMIFFLFFLALLIYVVKVDKTFIHKVEMIPFDDDKTTPELRP